MNKKKPDPDHANPPHQSDLFFIPLIAKAFEQPDPEKDLVEAFEQIENLGSQEPYRTGHEQFLQFMEEARSSPGLEILIERDGMEMGRVQSISTAEETRFPQALPGRYRISLSTGRLLWEGTLTREDLIWGEAFPGAPLPMAADSGKQKAPCTKEVPLLAGELLLRVYPGVEHGTVWIQIKPWNQE